MASRIVTYLLTIFSDHSVSECKGHFRTGQYISGHQSGRQRNDFEHRHAYETYHTATLFFVLVRIDGHPLNLRSSYIHTCVAPDLSYDHYIAGEREKIRAKRINEMKIYYDTK